MNTTPNPEPQPLTPGSPFNLSPCGQYYEIPHTFIITKEAIDSKNIEDIADELIASLEDGMAKDIAEGIIHQINKPQS